MTVLDFCFLGFAGLVVLLSWVGVGWGVFRGLGLGRWAGGNWAVLAAMGMAGMTVAGGLMAALGIVSVGLVGGISAGGAVAGAAVVFRRWRGKLGGEGWFWIVPLGLLAVVVYAKALTSPLVNGGDDKQSYLLFPKQMLQSGTLLAPFNIRRVATYGGHQFLQAQLMATTEMMYGRVRPGASDWCLTHGHVLDAGICVLLAAGLAYRWVRRRGRWNHALAGLAAAVVLLLPVPRMNTQSEISGLVLFLALGLMLPRLWRGGRCNVRGAVVVGILAAGVASLRMNFAGGVGVVLAFSAAWPFGRSASEWWRRLASGWVVWAVMGLGILPWAIVLLKSSGTLFYPLMHGNQVGTTSFLDATMSTWARVRWTVESLAYPSLLVLLLPVILAVHLRRWKDCVPLYVGAVGMTLITAWCYTNVTTANLHRYYWPVVTACALGTLASAMRGWEGLSRTERWATLILLVAIPGSGIVDLSEIFRMTCPLVMISGFLLLVFGERVRGGMGEVMGVGAVGMLAWSVGVNSGVMSDGGSRILCLAGVGGVAWMAATSERRLVKMLSRIAVVFALLLLARGAISLYGWGLVGAAGLAAAGVTTMAWMILRGAHRRWPIGSIGLGLMGGLVACTIAVAGGIFLEGMERVLFFGSLAALAWVGGRVKTVRMQVVAMVGVAALVGRWSLADVNFAVGEEVMFSASLQETYRRAQETVPAGAAIFVRVADPARLDFARNRLLTADYSIAFVSPPPHVPVDGDVQRFRAYWKGQGIRYMMLTPGDGDAGSSADPPELRESFATVEHASRILFESGEVVVLDLETR